MLLVIMKTRDDALEIFVENPSKLTKKFIEIVDKKKKIYDELLKAKGFLRQIINGVKLRLWYKHKYEEIYEFVKHYDIKTDSVKGLFQEFDKIADMIFLNNMLLMYSHLTEKKKKNISRIITVEDKKMIMLKGVALKKNSCDEFKKKFGHYALNAFELSSPRFSEYNDNEIMKIAKFTKEFECKKNVELSNCIHKPEQLFHVYSALREELRSIALLIVSKIRYKLLKVAKEKKIKNIFDLSYEDVLRLGEGT